MKIFLKAKAIGSQRHILRKYRYFSFLIITGIGKNGSIIKKNPLSYKNMLISIKYAKKIRNSSLDTHYGILISGIKNLTRMTTKFYQFFGLSGQKALLSEISKRIYRSAELLMDMSGNLLPSFSFLARSRQLKLLSLGFPDKRSPISVLSLNKILPRLKKVQHFSFDIKDTWDLKATLYQMFCAMSEKRKYQAMSLAIRVDSETPDPFISIPENGLSVLRGFSTSLEFQNQVTTWKSVTRIDSLKVLKLNIKIRRLNEADAQKNFQKIMRMSSLEECYLKINSEEIDYETVRIFLDGGENFKIYHLDMEFELSKEAATLSPATELQKIITFKGKIRCWNPSTISNVLLEDIFKIYKNASHFSLSMTGQSDDFILFSEIIENMPRLTTLKLKCRSINYKIDLSQKLKLIDSIRVLKLSDLGISSDLSNVNHIGQFLQIFPNLVSLSVSLNNKFKILPFLKRIMLAEKLKYLDIKFAADGLAPEDLQDAESFLKGCKQLKRLRLFIEKQKKKSSYIQDLLKVLLKLKAQITSFEMELILYS